MNSHYIRALLALCFHSLLHNACAIGRIVASSARQAVSGEHSIVSAHRHTYVGTGAAAAAAATNNALRQIHSRSGSRPVNSTECRPSVHSRHILVMHSLCLID